MDNAALVERLKHLPLTDCSADPLAVHVRLLDLAKRGIAPESLHLHEVKQVCYALKVHYDQFGLD